ncbi:MAG: preprotein translocase subunit SecY [Candidatus Aenigmarchaeota archaeon]|nr:preprotein translocase subunit SecY [Candidatus Aenigmarchaeota archaeon]
MGLIDAISARFPSVGEPKTHISFKSRLKWTGIILLLYLGLGQIILYGISATSKTQFQFYDVVLGSSIGSLMTLGIGPIVTASIILQLLVGSGLIPWNLRTLDGKKKFQNTQKLMVILFAVFEAFAYVSFGAVRPASADIGLFVFLIIQLAVGGVLVLFMDEVVSKWGIGSGVSLFIAAGVTRQIFIRTFNPLTPEGSTVPAGIIPQFISLMGMGELMQAFLALIPLLGTIIVFLIVVYVQGMKVEIPLAFGSIRGFARRWPLNLIYTSNIPVILVAALLANLQLMGSMTATTTTEGGMKCGILGCYDPTSGQAQSGLVTFFTAPRSLPVAVFFLTFLGVIFIVALLSFFMRMKGGMKTVGIAAIGGLVLAILVSLTTLGLPTGEQFLHVLIYLIILTVGSMIFSIFWVATSGMDSRSVAEQIEGMGMQIPGFRRDPRIVEEVLQRYIPTLTILSGLFIGILASVADFTDAVGTGTGILLTAMIIYNLYENIAGRYMEDMHPAFRKFFS